MEIKNSEIRDVLVREMPGFLENLDLIISGKRNEEVGGFHLYSRAYSRTTENINGYYNLFDFKGKSILTVIGSGEQILEAVSRGAKKVDAFDISMTAVMLYYLKEAALKSPDFLYDDYIKFFYTITVTPEDFQEVYARIKSYLNPIAKPFWEKVFTSDNPRDVMSKITWLRRLLSVKQAISILPKWISHLNEANYYELKKRINDCEVNIVISDVKELDSLEGPYDYIMFSNIYQYQIDENFEKFKQAIERYKSKLAPNGKIMVGYGYSDVDLTAYPEYDKIKIPARSMDGTDIIADVVMITRK